ncbi:2-succinyl-6-hydroxy-2, 4-cyclohexadiene-1-carboxylate synthase [Vibrio stylophorae]|uniref:2-succinyl-6-hydroxy-2, 4-cyclohexadiene-1-carboxylate synthase n=1 Tax=Vibrio stylophorae TaxID=659351 RepID=A0ABN8DRB4_9VIBR|nr:alpha/beta hydrolase [Vibrio stylophorae]CAH0533285.1 2-succinyl-6-hydroxy-2, 4-cyclohexadiene-1-carboxylate synthase [Vibrio stylophorae]
MQLHELLLPLADYSLAARSSTPDLAAEQPTLVFLHGWQDNANSFAPILPQLAPHFRVLAFDFPGHGLSPHRSEHCYYPFVDYLDELQQVLSLLASPYILVGHSMGGMLAATYAGLCQDENLKGLVLLESTGPIADSPDLAVERLQKGLKARQKWRKQRHKVHRGYETMDFAIAQRSRINRIDPVQITPLVERALECRQGRWFWRHDRKTALPSLTRFTEPQVESILRQIQVPIFTLLAEQGYDWLKQDLKLRKTWLHAFECEILAGCHHFHLQCPDLVSAKILAFAAQNFAQETTEKASK